MRLITFSLLILSCLFGFGQAHHCTVACPKNIPTLVKPKAQHTYVYSVDAKTLLNVRDTQKVTIKGDAELAIVSDCEAVLHLKNMAIEGVPNGADIATQLQAKPIAFGYHNGRVMGMCPAKDDEDWAVNIKKAIVSGLQIQFDEDHNKAEEIDLSGRCPTDYRKISNKDGTLVMEKKKNLNLCEDRRIDMRQTSDQALGQLKELLRHHVHLMNNDQVCRMTVKDQVVSNVDCEERHRLVYRSYKPLLISNLRMELKESKEGIAEDLGETDAEPKSSYLQFEPKHKTATEADVVEVLKKLCTEVSQDSLSIETSFTFQSLVNKLRHLSDDETTSVDEAVKTSICPEHKKRIRELFLDASAYAASDGSIRTLVKAHDNEELSVTRASALFSVVALKAAPNGKTVQSLLPIIASEKTIRPFLLGFSVLVRRYCEKTDDCATNPDVKDAREAYLARLAVAKDSNDKMNIIRALENLNVQTESTENMINQLDELVRSSEEPAIRSAAVYALPNDASQVDRYKTLAMDEAMPNEVRVAAFQKMVQNNGLGNMKEMFDIKGECMKNYVLSYVNNLKKAKNSKRREGLEEDIELPELPSMKMGHTRNIAREYGPYTFEYDIVYPKDENITRSINARITRSTKEKVKDIMQVQIYQKGFDKELSNILNLLERKSIQAGLQFVRDAIKFLMNLRKEADADKHLKVTVKVNGKNAMYMDVFQDMQMIRKLIRKRLDTVAEDKKADRTLGAILIDSKVVVPTLNGLPLCYKMGDNFVIQYNGEVNGEKGNRNVKLNWSFIGGLYGKMKLKVKDERLGYGYDAKMSYVPHMDVDIVTGDRKMLLRWNVGYLEEKTVMKFKQTLREKRSANDEVELDNEIAPEARSDHCFNMFLMNYCRKTQNVKGLVWPNVEYVISKPEKEVTAIELEMKAETEGDDKKSRRYTAQLTAVGSPTNKQAKIEMLATKGKEYKLTMKTPDNEFVADYTMEADKNYLKMNMDLPHGVKANVNGEFDYDKETNIRKSKIKVEYKMPDDDETHTLDLDHELSFNLKRSSKEKNTSFDYKGKWVSSRFPCTNHKTALQFKYRPFKVNEMNMEIAFGKDFEHHYQFMRNSQMEVEEMRPFKMNGNSEIKLIATGFDVDYDLKSDFKYESNKGTPMNLEYKVKGKDRSKRAADIGQDEVEGNIDFKNSGSPIDYKMKADLKVRNNQYGYESEMKQTEPQQYEGKITITKNDKKIFINHKDQLTKPTETFKFHTDAEVTYSDSEMKKNYMIELTKDKDVYQMLSSIKRDGDLFYENNINVQKGGKMKWYYKRNKRQFDLSLDNVLNPHEGMMKLKVEDREYDIKMTREPFRYNDIVVEGNDKAYIKKGNLHMSIMDPSTLDIVTLNDGKINAMMDLSSPTTKSASLKIDSPKYELIHDGSITVSILNPKLLWTSYTKRQEREYKLDVDMARHGSMITWNRITPEKNNIVKYTRDGEQVNMEIDTDLIEGHVDGTVREGKIHMKGRQSDFEIESKYTYEDGKIVIEPTKSENGKLEGVLSRRVPSKLVLETPRVKLHMDYDRLSPVKKFKLDFDSPTYEKQIDAEYEPTKHYKYFSHGKAKNKDKDYLVSIDGIPRKAFKMDLEMLDFKFKVTKPEDSQKAQFSYTFNDYTETEEYDFDPHRAYYVNWFQAIEKYIKSFIVD